MSAYLQMGHHSRNLIGEKDLDEFTGIILSPVNRRREGLIEDVPAFRSEKEYDVVLDPQLYFPRSEMGKLSSHPYFPNDFDTADLSQIQWWYNVNLDIAKYCQSLNVNTVVAPSFKPRKWNIDYFDYICTISNHLKKQLNKSGIRVLTPIFLDPSSDDLDDIYKIASVMSKAETDGFYIIADTGKNPRREIQDELTLTNYLKLIYELSTSLRKPILVSHASAEMVLLKCAGATSCASGKFFNLRRFTPSRYSKSDGGGGQLPYWFEQSLFGFLREADVLRLQDKGYDDLLCSGFSDNYWSKKILKHLDETPEEPWLAYSWRQYLSWFCKTETFLSNGHGIDTVNSWLEDSEKNWTELSDNKVLFDEIPNNGDWIRKWRIALIDLEEHINKNN